MRTKSSNTPSVAAYAIAVGGDGRPADIDHGHRPMTDERFREQLASIREGIDKHPLNEGKKKILVFVHGGLSTLPDARKNVVSRHPKILQAGYYPVFVNWECGPFVTYLEHLFFIRSGRRRSILGPLTYPFVFLADVSRGLVGTPNRVFRRSFNFLRLLLGGGDRQADELEAELKARFADDPASAIETLIRPSKRSMFRRVSHGPTWLLLPIAKVASVVGGALIEGPGTAAWRNMQRRTTTIFRRPEEFDLAERRRNGRGGVSGALDSPASGAAAMLMEMLCDLTSAASAGADAGSHRREANWDYEITLVGHSMGVIVLNEMIALHDHLPYRNIVYMAAACSIRDSLRTVVPYLERQSGGQRPEFFNLCLHPGAERSEINAFDAAPRGSLLEWIDDIFESPRAFIDRRAGKWENLVQATHVFPPSVRGQVNVKVFGWAPGSKAEPQKHGEFDNFKFWDRAYWI